MSREGDFFTKQLAKLDEGLDTASRLLLKKTMDEVWALANTDYGKVAIVKVATHIMTADVQKKN